MDTKRGTTKNRVLVAMIVLGFLALAGAFIHSQNLTEYEGTLEENLSFELPAGYALQETQEDAPDDQQYVRETDSTLETIDLYYAGLYADDSYIIDETIPLGDGTEVGIGRLNWTNDYDNELEFTVRHGDECYLLRYQCQETDKDNYYSSCSKAQEEEILGFIRTFDYHRPDGSDMNALQRLHSNYGTGGCVVLALALLFFIGIPVAIGIAGVLGSGSKSSTSDTVVTSRDLHRSMNREREAKGESSLPSINTVQGASTSNLARRDHSWSSVPDFFIKMFRKH